MTKQNILEVGNKQEEKFLRKKTELFTVLSKGAFRIAGKELSRKEVSELIARMRRVMQEANGIGLSANQIGLPYRLFVARVPDAQGNYKVYSIFNPEFEKIGKGKALLEEGCLSVPGTYGNVERATEATLRGFDRNGRPVKIKAWGLLAHVFQHEVDHLDGKLFIDTAKEVYDVAKSERLAAKQEK